MDADQIPGPERDFHLEARRLFKLYWEGTPVVNYSPEQLKAARDLMMTAYLKGLTPGELAQQLGAALGFTMKIH